MVVGEQKYHGSRFLRTVLEGEYPDNVQMGKII